MKTRSSILGLALILTGACALCLTACGDNDDNKDMTPPAIGAEGIVANPVNCQVYHRGDVIPFAYVFTDDTELGNYNIEIHDNSDHHSHSTEADHDHDGDGECTHDADHDLDLDGDGRLQHWVYNRDFAIPAGQRVYTARQDIAIPDTIAPGDYHFMIRLTDRAGWQQLKALAIEIE